MMAPRPTCDVLALPSDDEARARAVGFFRAGWRSDLALWPETVLSRAERIYAGSTTTTLIQTVKRTGLSRKRVKVLAFAGAVLEADGLGEDDRAFERRALAALAWGDSLDASIIEAVFDALVGPA